MSCGRISPGKPIELLMRHARGTPGARSRRLTPKEAPIGALHHLLVLNSFVIVGQPVKANEILAREKTEVAFQVLYEFADRDNVAVAIVHQPANRQNLRGDMSVDKRLA